MVSTGNNRVVCQWLLHTFIQVNADPIFQNRDDRSTLAEAALILGCMCGQFTSHPHVMSDLMSLISMSLQ